MQMTFPTALFLLFLILKLTHAVAWSWWWITAPLWLVPVIVVAAIAAFVVAMRSKF